MKKSAFYSILVICATVIIAVLCYFLILTPKNSDDGDFTPPSAGSLNSPQIICSYNNISLELANKTFKFEYQILYDENHTHTAIINNTQIVCINDGYLIPKSVGNTYITINVYNMSQEIVTYKNIPIQIKSVATSATYKILDSNNQDAQTLYCNKFYTLQIFEDFYDSTSPSITFDTQNAELNFVSYENCCVSYSLKILTIEQFAIKYSKKYFDIDINILAYIYPDDFNITFEREILNNEINLYIFDKTYTSQASNDGYFDKISFDIVKIKNSNDIITASISGDAYIQDNVIYPTKSGFATLTFKSQISNITKTYSIKTNEILPQKIVIENTSYDVNSIQNISLKYNQTKNLNFEYFPIYALNDFEIICESCNLDSSNYLNLNSDNCSVKINNFNKCILTLNITRTYEYVFKISLQQYDGECNFENNTLNIIRTGSEQYMSLKCTIFNQSLQQNYQPNVFACQSLNPDIIFLSDSITNGIILLQVNSVGSTTLTIKNEELNLETTITVNIS